VRRERVSRLGVFARAVGGAAAVVAALCGACSVQDVVVARYMTEGMGGPCNDSTDCDPVAFCAKTSCDALQGQCQLRPIVPCGDEQLPVCGCDGVSYWNDCLRQQLGIASSIQNQCTAPYAPCGGRKGTACPTAGALCARLVADQCDPEMGGACWVLPPQCPPAEDGGALWQSCFQRPPMCADVCRAIRSEAPFRSFAGATCP
jgi:hypothetical protein